MVGIEITLYKIFYHWHDNNSKTQNIPIASFTGRDFFDLTVRQIVGMVTRIDEFGTLVTFGIAFSQNFEL